MGVAGGGSFACRDGTGGGGHGGGEGEGCRWPRASALPGCPGVLRAHTPTSSLANPPPASRCS
eukprot:scaffold11807_cov101-Isochrysis_galbana.AAC.2